MPYDRYNFHKHTFCIFEERPLAEISGLRANHISRSGSSYFFTTNGVYRLSDHWGRAAQCKWRLESREKKSGLRLGFALWTAFHPDNATDKIYFIHYDIASSTVSYQHKNQLNPDETKALFSATDVTKRIREIRKLLASEGWARHFETDITWLRETLILAITSEGKTLQQAKTGLLR
ncbi:hypothetical protein [Flavobacterium magnum]|nr:hypothetical protein [Flavobacterium magnum]